MKTSVKIKIDWHWKIDVYLVKKALRPANWNCVEKMKPRLYKLKWRPLRKCRTNPKKNQSSIKIWNPNPKFVLSKKVTKKYKILFVLGLSKKVRLDDTYRVTMLKRLKAQQNGAGLVFPISEDIQRKLSEVNFIYIDKTFFFNYNCCL